MSYRRGHVKGHKREKRGNQDWYAQQGHEQAWIDKVTKEWGAQAQAPQPQAPAERAA